jgi:hypothetical protein
MYKKARGEWKSVGNEEGEKGNQTVFQFLFFGCAHGELISDKEKCDGEYRYVYLSFSIPIACESLDIRRQLDEC